MQTLPLALFRGLLAEETGRLPDGLVEGIEDSVEVWQAFLDLAHANRWLLWWRRDCDAEEPPRDAARLFAVQHSSTLALAVGADVQVNVFTFPGSGTFDFDFDLRELRSEAAVTAFSSFVRGIGRFFSHPVLLCHEGEVAFLRYEPGEDAFIVVA